MQQLRHCGISIFPEHFAHGSCRIIDPVTMKEIRSHKVDDEELYNDSKNCWNTIRSWVKA